MAAGRRGEPPEATNRFFVKCSACDQTFWLSNPATPVPEHGAWNRRLERSPNGAAGCPGAGRPGHWIGEDADDRPLSPPERPDDTLPAC